MKFVKVLLGIAFLLGIAAFVLSLMGPEEVNVERSVTINASEQVVASNIKTIEASKKWDPWLGKDSNAVITYEGEAGTVGSKCSWKSDHPEVGEGNQEIVEVTESGIKTKLTFISPQPGEADASLMMAAGEEGVTVTWGFTSKTNFMMRVMTVFMDFDAMIGADFEKGLENLKTLCEDQDASINGYKIERTTWEGKKFFGKREKISFDAMKNFFGKNFGGAFTELGKKGIQPMSAPSAMYWEWDMENQMADLAAVAQVGEDVDSKKFEMFNSPASEVLKIEYFGSYEDMAKPHEAMEAYMKKNGLEFNELVIEEYLTDPESEPDTSKWQTNVYYLVK